MKNMKRMLDVVAAIFALFLFSPIICITALIIKLKIGSPILFKQLRPGLQGKPFTIYKFRTMTDERDSSGQLLPDDQRLTTLGKWLRKTSIDELPQLINVLKGELSLVGPRPLLMEYLPRYSKEQARRHDVKPGITGWAQVNGRNALSWEEKFKLDLYYVEHQSFLLDLKILWMTLLKVFKSEGISQAGHATMPIFTGKEGAKEQRYHNMTNKDKLLSKINDRSAKIGIVGLGYVGLPLAVEKAKQGFSVVGIERNQERVDQVNSGVSYIADVANEDVAEVVHSGKLRAVLSFTAISHLDVIIICVPTPLTKNLTPNLQYVEHVTEQIAKQLKKGQFVCLESTTYPGTTEEVCLPILEKSSLEVEEDFYLAHSPERVDPGNKSFSTKNTNKVVGGVGPHSIEIAKTLYEQIVDDVVTVSSAKAAELVKVYENTFRAVNIALVNELTLLCDKMGLNVWEVLDAAFTKPFGIMPFYPGPGVGGHCIPIDPHYLEWKAKELNFHTHFITLAGEINRKMPEFVRERALRILNDNGKAPSKAKVLLIGVAYKKDVSDHRESPALQLINLLQESGAQVTYHDPFVPKIISKKSPLTSLPLTVYNISAQDLIIITNDHTTIDYQKIIENSAAVLDTKNVTKDMKNEDLLKKVTLL
jgi:UDP-N-acetyl-D-glucosamine dehydrogenase